MNEIREVIFEDGTVGYLSAGHHFDLFAVDGSPISQVSERVLSEEELTATDILHPAHMCGELKNGKWHVRPKTSKELASQGITKLTT